MTNQPMTIPAAVAHINALINRAVVLGDVPEPRHSWNDRALMLAEEAKSLTFMPGWNLEFGVEFGCRVTLDVHPGHKRLGTACRVSIGTSGNQRTVAETAKMAKLMTGICGVAADIEAFMNAVDPQPLPEAVEAEEKRYEEHRVASEKAQAEALAAEKAVRSERAKKAVQTRKENAAFRR